MRMGETPSKGSLYKSAKNRWECKLICGGDEQVERIAELGVIDPDFFEGIAGDFGDVVGKLPLEVEM